MRTLSSSGRSRSRARAGGVVLWRPFHEMNGGWFWWGAKEPEQFIRVWRHMFDYFTKTKGLDNLLWVYSPNHGNKTADYYAGDQYVDIVGLDAYTDFVDPQHIRGYEAVARLPKPFGFTEFGPHGPHNPPGNYDYPRLLDGVQKHFPKTTFFLAWHNKWSLGRNEHAKHAAVDVHQRHGPGLAQELHRAPEDLVLLGPDPNGALRRLHAAAQHVAGLHESGHEQILRALEDLLRAYRWTRTHRSRSGPRPSHAFVQR